MHPARGVDRLGGALRVLPVAEHHGVAARAQLARLAARHGAAGVRVDDLDLDVRVHAADGADAALEVVVGAGLGRDRRGLGHAVTDGHLLHVHALDDLAHHLDRARRAGHDPGAQRAEVEGGEVRVGELGDEHRRHAVEARAALLLTASSTAPGSNAGAGTTMHAPWVMPPRLPMTMPKQW